MRVVDLPHGACRNCIGMLAKFHGGSTGPIGPFKGDNRDRPQNRDNKDFKGNGLDTLNVITKNEMVLRTIFLFVDTFIKTCSWKSLTKNKVKGRIY